ncbi:hypothetical protein PR003_g1632 [Phytophthora rubi]|uniref:Uncharacterized protein n=1 Tax=Phytophthora rubi TaxID=129364 RepID=A0A6A3NB43_9STRA|nr:hypothetical protein PR001_g14398 [Phytophthora rubi]KAE9040816.1 hypothetical protein PR002_g4755 [Phytophthora rubi]KAE9357689.1 hypothetical protein PR003_g1632 [Phytophthora rubi]
MKVAPTPAVGETRDEFKFKKQPKFDDNTGATSSYTCLDRVLELGRKLFAGYNKLQVSHRGMYSLERLKAFQAYCEKTSTAHAVAVCLLTPVPPLLGIVLLECIPVVDPDLGWKANFGFWVRFFLSGMIIALCTTYQISGLIERLHLSLLKSVRIAVMVMTLYAGTLVVIAAVWVFPVPFGVVVGIGPCFLVFSFILVFTIGLKTFKANPGLTHEIQLQFCVLGVQGLIAILYPAFSGIYAKASSNERAGLVLLLPLTKLTMKNIVAWASSHLEDQVPLIAVFSIEVFNALYVATCMQSTKSTLATVIIISFDVVSGIFTFYSLIHRTRAIQRQMQRLEADLATEKHESGDLVPKVMAASQHLRSFRTRRGPVIRVRAPLRLLLDVENERVLESLTRHLVSFEKREAVRVPIATKMGIPQGEDQKLELVESALQLLFNCEYHVLVEYVECAVPLIFGIYLSILCQLPSRKFYPMTRDMVGGQLESMLTSLSVYVALEILSFVVMHVALTCKFKLSALYLLAFVLETQVVQIQARLFFWIVFILQFTLQHYGVDFSFHFAWIHQH